MSESDHIFPKRILKKEAVDVLERPFVGEKIIKAINLCGKDKAPDPDGFTAEFFLQTGISSRETF